MIKPLEEWGERGWTAGRTIIIRSSPLPFAALLANPSTRKFPFGMVAKKCGIKEIKWKSNQGFLPIDYAFRMHLTLSAVILLIQSQYALTRV